MVLCTCKPENSVFALDDPFSEIQIELNKFTDRYSSICIFGDWNSRTKDFEDFISADFDIFHGNNLDDLYNEFEEELLKFNDTQVRQNRKNGIHQVIIMAINLLTF